VIAVYYIGLIGMFLIITGWIVSFKETPPFSLSVLYCLGSSLLAYYAHTLGDPIFLFLNSLAAIVSLLNAIRCLVKSRKKGSS